VTYGPFAHNTDGQPFPCSGQVREDLTRMRAAGINAIRTYHVPPDWLCGQIADCGLRVLIDIPWSKHLCFLGNARVAAHARGAVRNAVRSTRATGAVLAYNLGNEIPADIVRWHGSHRVAKFLAELRDIAKQEDPEGLTTYANFPPTEYLELPFLDFATFNVYLHDPARFRSYLLRLQNLVGDRPLVLGEIGMDTYRHGETEQAMFLAGHVQEARMAGVAGTFVFAWTDEWHTGGHAVEDWAFGITRTDRAPKPSFHELQAAFQRPLSASLRSVPRVSVIVCTYNGGRTLDQCLSSLLALDYANYEVIVVDDGSTDETRSVLSRNPGIRVIHQENQGLGAARNVGLQAASGEIVAYTDSDCYADRDWLTHLVAQLERSGASAVGGPNLNPRGTWLAACVAASPGQPTHVLIDDQTAEHIPGCNMAFRREALEAINGFDSQFRTAGDDVDVCWRLQHEGYQITFAPGATIWHHPRQTPIHYLRQQAGYGQAEGLLHFKHPDRFTGWGASKWRGVVYGAAAADLGLFPPIIYRGTFATGLFQCLYQRAPMYWATLPSSLEWHVLAVVIVLAAAAVWLPLAALGALMVALALLAALLRAFHASLPADRRGARARSVVTALCYLQPLVRSWARHRARFFPPGWPEPELVISGEPGWRLPWTGRRATVYWSAAGPSRIAILKSLIEYLSQHRIGHVIDSGWSDWDVGVYSRGGTLLKIATVEEDHGGGNRLIRVRFGFSPTPMAGLLGLSGLLVLVVLGRPWGVAIAVSMVVLGARMWRRASQRAGKIVGIFDVLASELGMVRCPDWAEDSLPMEGLRSSGSNCGDSA